MSYIGNSPTSVAFVTDLFNGTGSQTAFTMSVAPANSASVLVAVSGVLQSPDTYSVSGTTLTFSAAPPSGTGNISARYLGIPASGVTTTAYRTVTEFTATAGQTTFTPPSYTAGYINVYRNGVLLGSTDYTATNGTTVVLASGATAGDLVTVESFYVSSVVGAIPATAGAVTDTYLNTGAVTQSKLAAGVAGNGPAFAATIATTQSISSSTWTKVAFATEAFDTNNCYDTTNYRFTPNVAGYYQINALARIRGTGATTNKILAIRKNGTVYRYVDDYPVSIEYFSLFLSNLIYMNGSTDYLEIWAYTDGTNTSINYDANANSEFSGSLVRSA